MALDRGRDVGVEMQRAGQTRGCSQILAIQAKGAFVALVLDAKCPSSQAQSSWREAHNRDAFTLLMASRWCTRDESTCVRAHGTHGWYPEVYTWPASQKEQMSALNPNLTVYDSQTKQPTDA